MIIRTPDQEAAVICNSLYSALAKLECASEGVLAMVASELLETSKEDSGWDKDYLEEASKHVMGALASYAALLHSESRLNMGGPSWRIRRPSK